MEVQIISTELIKPSGSTPDHFRYLKMSFLDQWQAQIAVPFVYFYPKSSKFSNSERCKILKHSLSKTLTVFYPLAGRIKDNFHIECNDEGVFFVEAKANCDLSTILNDRNANVYENFVPRRPEDVGDLVAFYQITSFNCGGLALSFALSHKFCDAASDFLFMKSWVAIAKGHSNVQSPQFGFSSLFPPSNAHGFEQTLSEENSVTKIFSFRASAIEALKAKYEAQYGEKLSRVEALSVFIWSRFMASTQNKGSKKRYKVFHWVNLRPRMQLPKSKISIGNLVTVVQVEATLDNTNDECYGIVKRTIESLKTVDSTYIRKLQRSEDHLKILNEMGRDDAVCFDFSSLCNLSMYESDFGWGKPLFVGTCPHSFENLVYFFDTQQGNGIDAWIGLKEEDMAKFETDNELRQHLSSTPFSKM